MARRKYGLCADCGVDVSAIGEYYMIRHDLWDAVAGPEQLCIGCLEARLGRELGPFDFTDAPANFTGWKSARLKERAWGDTELADALATMAEAITRRYRGHKRDILFRQLQAMGLELVPDAVARRAWRAMMGVQVRPPRP